MSDQETNISEAIWKKRARIEQIDRILSGPLAIPASRHALRLIEEKQHHQLALSELERALTSFLPRPTVPQNGESGLAEKGKLCIGVVNDIRKVKNLCRQSGYSVAEVRKKHPDWTVWRVVEGLSEECREMFHHPNQWGPVVGYAEALLGKYYGRSPATIHDWCKMARRLDRKGAPQT